MTTDIQRQSPETGIHDTIPESLVPRSLPAATPTPSQLNMIHGNHLHVSAVATLADGEDTGPLTSSQNDGESRRRQLLQIGRPWTASAVATTPSASESTRSFRTREFRQSESRRLAGRGLALSNEQQVESLTNWRRGESRPFHLLVPTVLPTEGEA
ncbi:hypothetical protein LZ31DRAFT_598981 [Colletotrichum somersetense]|nr:hypothetical protein LZ31DRAFT_598981 [Colletotrichum somersetense]